jgi:transcriptional regulator with XRE-family HTH domain
METSVDRSRSSFRDLREARGFDRDAVAKELDVTVPTVRGWDLHGRPRLGHLRHVAQLFGIDLLDAIERIWGEAPGNPCPGGPGRRCSGVKVLPDSHEATHLYIKNVCTKCQHETQPVRPGVHRHSEVCRKCYEDDEQIFTCVGVSALQSA